MSNFKQVNAVAAPMGSESNLTALKAEKSAPPRREKGGRGSRQQRSDDRRFKRNVDTDKQIQDDVAKRLGISETPQLEACKPAFSVRPGGVHVSLLGLAEATRVFLRHLRTVARRPLDLLLTQENCQRHIKTSRHLASVRIFSAQQFEPYAQSYPKLPDRFYPATDVADQGSPKVTFSDPASGLRRVSMLFGTIRSKTIIWQSFRWVSKIGQICSFIQI